MQRIFGFDIGTTSIGWAVIDHDAARAVGCIVGMGVRIFPEARDPDGTPLNQIRRQKRLIRRQLRRRKLRRRALNELLNEAGLLPPFAKGKRVNGSYVRSSWEEVMQLPPLELRKKALAERLEPYELGRALYHLAHRRHFKGRDVESDTPVESSAEEKAAQSARATTVQILQESGKTLGEMLAERAPTRGEIPRQRTRGIHALREHVIEEFNRIIEAQRQHHPILRDPVFVDQLRNVVFSQKPVFWRTNTLGECPFVPSSPLCPKGSWLSQQRRMLEKLNNLSIVGGNLRPLDSEERAAILEKLQVKASMTWTAVRAALKPVYAKRGEPGAEQALRFNLELGGESQLPGNLVEAKLASIFGERWKTHPYRQAIRDAIHERLWKADYAEIGTQRVVILPETERRRRRAELAKTFVHEYGISDFEAKALSELQLPAGWEPYSVEALWRFLPLLEQGVRFGALVAGPEWAKWREATFPNRQQPSGGSLDLLPSPANSGEQKRLAAIRNPTVVRVLNELRKVTNNLIRVHGKPDLIRIELAREIGLSKRERAEIREQLRRQEKRRREAEEDLKSKGILQPTRAEIEKWLLWKESQERCPYTGDHISFDALFRNGEYDVEHIWPRSRSLDDSFRNKTLCRRDVNIEKGNRTPFEFYQSRPDEWAAIVTRLRGMTAKGRSAGMPYGKVKRFLAESMPEDFANRQLTDTSYAAREAVTFLKRLGSKSGAGTSVAVQAVAGRVTAQLRRLWQLNNMLADNAEKTRSDHRHHAIDALVVACTDPGMVHRLSRYWQQKDDPRAERPHLPAPWPGIRAEVQQLKDCGEIRISHRVRKKVSGPLHDEKPYGDTGKEIMKNGTILGVFVKRMPVEKLSLETLKIDDVAQISKTAKFVVRDKAIREALRNHLAAAGGDPKKAYPPYPRVTPNGPEIRSVRVLSLQQKSLMAPVAMSWNGERERQPNGFAELGTNHHVAIYRTSSGKAEYEIVSLYEAARRLARGEPIVRRQRDGAKFVMSLAAGEAVEFLDGERKGIWIVQGVWANGQVVLTRDYDARPTSKKESERLGMSGKREEFYPKVSTLISDSVRKISVDPIGRIRVAND